MPSTMSLEGMRGLGTTAIEYPTPGSSPPPPPPTHRMSIPPGCSQCRHQTMFHGVDNRWLGPNLSTRTGGAQFFGLATPANDIAIQLPALIAANEWETISSLLAGLSPEELQAVSDRAIALYDIPAETMKAIIATLGKTEVIEVSGKAPALVRIMTPRMPWWAWAIVALGAAALGIFIYQRKKAGG